MAKNIKFLYKKHISDTAPDMEKLWDRIEGQLENKTDKDQTQIKVCLLYTSPSPRDRG